MSPFALTRGVVVAWTQYPVTFWKTKSLEPALFSNLKPSNRIALAALAITAGRESPLPKSTELPSGSAGGPPPGAR